MCRCTTCPGNEGGWRRAGRTSFANEVPASQNDARLARRSSWTNALVTRAKNSIFHALTRRFARHALVVRTAHDKGATNPVVWTIARAVTRNLKLVGKACAWCVASRYVRNLRIEAADFTRGARFPIAIDHGLARTGSSTATVGAGSAAAAACTGPATCPGCTGAAAARGTRDGLSATAIGAGCL